MTMQNTSKNGTAKKSSAEKPVETAPAESAGTTPGSVDTKKLWAEIRSIEEKAKRLEEQQEALVSERSAVLKELQASLGSGPFQIAGLGLVNIRSRKSKVEGKPDTYFFVTMGAKNVTVID